MQLMPLLHYISEANVVLLTALVTSLVTKFGDFELHFLVKEQI